MATKVRVKTTYASPHGTARAGQVIELPDGDATGLIDAGYAEAYLEPAEQEPIGDSAAGQAPDETTSLEGAPETTEGAPARSRAARPKPKTSRSSSASASTRRAATNESGSASAAGGDAPNAEDLLG